MLQIVNVTDRIANAITIHWLYERETFETWHRAGERAKNVSQQTFFLCIVKRNTH